MGKVSRREFLRMLGLSVPAAVVAPAVARKYFFAPAGGWQPEIVIAGWDFGAGRTVGRHYFELHGRAGEWLGISRADYPGPLARRDA